MHGLDPCVGRQLGLVVDGDPLGHLAMTALTSHPAPADRCPDCGSELIATETSTVVRPASDPEDFMQQGSDWVRVCVKCAQHSHSHRATPTQG